MDLASKQQFLPFGEGQLKTVLGEKGGLNALNDDLKPEVSQAGYSYPDNPSQMRLNFTPRPRLQPAP